MRIENFGGLGTLVRVNVKYFACLFFAFIFFCKYTVKKSFTSSMCSKFRFFDLYVTTTEITYVVKIKGSKVT